MRKTALRSLAAIAATTIFASAAMAATYKVIARNDLGMHCACPTFAGFLLLPPFNTIRAQVLTMGSEPNVVSSGVTVSYSLAEETDASLQTDPYFSQWITYSPKLFPGFQPVVGGKVKGIAGKGIADTMTYDSTSKSYIAAGIPAYPVTTGTVKDTMVDPLGGPKRDPYLTANIVVKNSYGTVVATTSTTVPVAFGGCCTCHLPLAAQNGFTADPTGSFAYMGKMHGANSSKIDFRYLDPTGDGTAGPIRCSWCHWDPAMGETAAPGLANVWPNFVIMPGAPFTRTDVKVSTRSFSDVLHKFHTQSTKVLTQWDANIATNCYACHPGNGVDCYRGTHKGKTAIWCIDCHGNLNQRVATNQMQTPWQIASLPTCFAPSPGITSTFTCHPKDTNNTYGWNPGLFGTFINNKGHEGSVLCESCHGSAHGEAPSTLALDNVQNSTLQTGTGFTFPTGKDKTYAIGVCNVCHTGRSNYWSRPPHTGN
jgi:hypothetical protein